MIEKVCSSVRTHLEECVELIAEAFLHFLRIRRLIGLKRLEWQQPLMSGNEIVYIQRLVSWQRPRKLLD